LALRDIRRDWQHFNELKLRYKLLNYPTNSTN
jgi:hypothetical protein